MDARIQGECLLNSNKARPTVTFTEEMEVTMKKEQFLSNAKKKQRFIVLLSNVLRESDCDVT